MPRYDFGRFPLIEHQKAWAAALLKDDVFSKLTDYEKKFAKDISQKLLFGVKLSEETVYKLEQIYADRT